MVPVGGATRRHPAIYFVRGGDGQAPVALVSTGAGSLASAFPFELPSAPGPGGTQALAVNTTAGGVVYDVEYALVTVSGGAPVTNTNSAYALARCASCTTVAVSFQVVLVVGHSDRVAPIDAAVAFNKSCPACVTTAIADQLVVTLSGQPTQELIDRLTAALRRLDALKALGANATPAQIAAEVEQVQQEVDDALRQSGLATDQTSTTTTATGTTTPATSTAETTTAPETTTAETTTADTTTTAETATTTAETTTAETTTAATTTTAETTTTGP
jgi:putative peptide zinc metalloprotease protein